MSIHYNYDTKSKVLKANFEGDVYLDDTLVWLNNLVVQKYEPLKCKRFLVNNDKAIFRDSLNKLSALDNFYQKHPQYFKGSRIAYIVNSPIQTARVQVLANRINNISIKAFSTPEAAIEWLQQI